MNTVKDEENMKTKLTMIAIAILAGMMIPNAFAVTSIFNVYIEDHDQKRNFTHSCVCVCV
jgi:hypothetical protein